MEIDKKNYNMISNLIDIYLKNKNYELECRFFSKNNSFIDYDKFENILNHLIFSKDFGGLGLTFYEDTILDISLNDDNIKTLIIKGVIMIIKPALLIPEIVPVITSPLTGLITVPLN
jgi:hypothetical protein